MKRFGTLVWLEVRRSGVWAVALLGSLVFWAWGLFQIREIEAAQQLGIRALLLGLAAAIGALILVLMVGRLRGDTRGGQFQMLLLSPPSGMAHILSRLTFALCVAAIYYLALGGLAWWSLALSGLHFDAVAAIQVMLALPLYGLGVAVLPLLSWTLLLMTFQSAYRTSGTAWIPGTVMVLGSLYVLRWLGRGVARVAYSLPAWPVLGSVGLPLGESLDAGSAGMTYAVDGAIRLPQEPLWIMIAVSAGAMLVAGRIWREVEA